MMISVRNTIRKCIENYRTVTREDWLNSWPGQIFICVSQYYWTQYIHNCLYSDEEKTKRDYYETLMVIYCY